MKRNALFRRAALAALVPVLCAAARAQESGAPKVEVGAQYSSLSITLPGRFSTGTDNAAGVGARVTFNVTNYLALEAEGNFYPTRTVLTFASGGRAEQLQAGVKVGKRMERWGLFAKARPGFVSFDETLRPVAVELVDSGGMTFPILRFERERKTHFSVDVGGVLEFYPSRSMVVRFDAGDTIIRYGRHDVPLPFILEPGAPFQPVGQEEAQVKHNFQFTAGVAYRFGGDDGEELEAPSEPGRDRVRRFEVGAQFSSLLLNLPDSDSIFFGSFGPDTEPEVGFGGRLTFNLSDSVAVEAEGNLYTRESFPATSVGGFPAQLQAGVKAGRRWERWGLFAKARPGLVSFSRVRQLVSTQQFTFEGREFTLGTFEDRRKNYFSMDVGAVVEFYHSRRFFSRFDAGDTIIHYGERAQEIFLGPQANFFQVPAETKHNFQFTAGIGFRF